MAETKTAQSVSPLGRYITDFLEYCEIGKNQSPKTIKAYGHFLSRFCGFAGSVGVKKPEDITLEIIKKYRLYLNRLQNEKGGSLKIITQNYHLIALRAFLKYLSKQDVVSLAPEKIELPKNPSRQVEFLEPEELERLFTAIAKEPNEQQRLRDNAIMHTLFSTGLRVSELASLRQDTTNLERGEFTVRGKGSKLRMVFLSPEATEALKKYLAKRKDNNKAIFVSHSTVGNTVEKEIESMGTTSPRPSPHEGRVTPRQARGREGLPMTGLTTRSIERVIKKYCRLAGIVKKVTPHTLRHSFATDLLRNGADIRSVQAMLGHASITTTQIYTHVTNEGLRDIHKKYHGKAS